MGRGTYRYRELRHFLRDLDGKIELGVKALWRDMGLIFRQIVEENEEINAAFLVDQNREREFDDLMERLDLRYRERMKFVYVGPVPPYNFVNLTLKPDE